MSLHIVRVSTISGDHLEDFVSWKAASQACQCNKWNLPVPGYVLLEAYPLSVQDDTCSSASSGLDTDSDDGLPDLEALIDAVQDLRMASCNFHEDQSPQSMLTVEAVENRNASAK